MPAIGIGIGIPFIQGGTVAEVVVEGPGGVGSPIGLLLVLTKAS